jgi:cobalt-zinc-cadmium efflux system membrane fusion protein
MRKAIWKIAWCGAFGAALAGCGKKFDPARGTASPSEVVENSNGAIVTVDHPEQFQLAAASSMEAPEKLSVTGSVSPDINREVPVISLASGRVVDIRARLDDNVKKGELLFKVQSPDATNAFDAFRKAVNDELLARKASQRAQDLFQHGAISQATLEQAEGAEKDAQADLTAADEQLQTMGLDKDHPSSIASVYAPISGVVVAQNITNAAAAGVTYSGSSTAFTIADLSVVWILCDVYENDLSRLRLGQQAQISLTAYPGKVLTGKVSDIGPVLDPTIRTAKVRIEVANPGMLRLGMFATATLLSRTSHHYAVVPTSAILHLHDRDWVFVPAGGNKFKRLEVTSGGTLPGDMQQILSGIDPGQQVVRNVLELEETVEGQ